MKRSEFLKRFFVGASVAVAQPLLTQPSGEEFHHKDIFLESKNNPRLIYPKKESPIYQALEKCFEGRIKPNSGWTYLPVHHLSIPIKERYAMDDFLPIKYYFESVYGRNHIYGIEGHGVAFRFIADSPLFDRMHLEVFLTGFKG